MLKTAMVASGDHFERPSGWPVALAYHQIRQTHLIDRQFLKFAASRGRPRPESHSP